MVILKCKFQSGHPSVVLMGQIAQPLLVNVPELQICKSVSVSIQSLHNIPVFVGSVELEGLVLAAAFLH